MEGKNTRKFQLGAPYILAAFGLVLGRIGYKDLSVNKVGFKLLTLNKV